MKNTQGLLTKLATSLAVIYTDTLHKIEETQEQNNSIQAMSEALRLALRQELPHGYPTRAHLRSHLSVLHEGRQYPTIIGFDDLYEDVTLCIDAARLTSTDNQNIIEIEEMQVAHHSALAWARRAESQLKAATIRVAELENHPCLREKSKFCDGAYRIMESLVNSGVILDANKETRVALLTWMADYEKTLGASWKIGSELHTEQWLEVPKLREELSDAHGRLAELESSIDQQAEHWHPHVVELRARNDRQRAFLERIAAICGVPTGNLEELVNKIVHAKALGEKLTAEVRRLSELAASRQKDVGQLRGANIKLIADAASIKAEVKKVLQEFRLESPTDDIQDMVRAACESGMKYSATNKMNDLCGPQCINAPDNLSTQKMVHMGSGSPPKQGAAALVGPADDNGDQQQCVIITLSVLPRGPRCVPGSKANEPCAHGGNRVDYPIT